MKQKRPVLNPEEDSPIEIQLSEENVVPATEEKPHSGKRDSSDECKIVGMNTAELLVEPAKVTTHRATIFGRGFIELDKVNDIN